MRVNVSYKPLETFLKNCRIPFIYGWNRDPNTVDPFKSLNCPKEDVFLANFTRCKNASEIDGRFNFVVEEQVKVRGGGFRAVLKEKLAIVECRNYRRNITVPELMTILRKCKNTRNVGLSLVFGTSFVKQSSQTRTHSQMESTEVEDGADESYTLFLNLCRTEKINVYRVIPGDFYNIVPFEPTMKLIPNPKFHCIVIEEIPINLYEEAKKN